jgi:hypothetical protein
MDSKIYMCANMILAGMLEDYKELDAGYLDNINDILSGWCRYIGNAMRKAGEKNNDWYGVGLMECCGGLLNIIVGDGAAGFYSCGNDKMCVNMLGICAYFDFTFKETAMLYHYCLVLYLVQVRVAIGKMHEGKLPLCFESGLDFYFRYSGLQGDPDYEYILVRYGKGG